MPFTLRLREELLVRSRRQCCVCNGASTRDVQVHHIVPEADDGLNDAENAIVLCLKCHAEAGHYNPRHPLGTKFSPSELKRHRDQWFAYCDGGFRRELRPSGYAGTSARDPTAHRKAVGVLWSQRADIDPQIEYIEFDGDLVASLETTDGSTHSWLELFRLGSGKYLVYVESDHRGDWRVAALCGASQLGETDTPLSLGRLQEEFPALATAAGLAPVRHVE